MPVALPRLSTYAEHARATLAWLMRSIEHGRGGSCAHFSLASGWSKPYPETTGYLIPTLLESEVEHARAAALALGRWLLSIQNPDGSWNNGVIAARDARPSVFNTGQFLHGLIALHRAGHDGEFLPAALRRALARLAAEPRRPVAHRRLHRDASATPSYYTMLWPMLDGSSPATKCAAAPRPASRRSSHARATTDGSSWASTTASARSRTRRVRLRILSARILGAWDEIGAQAARARADAAQVELGGGRLAGELIRVEATAAFECLTGSAQTAINLLLWEREVDDLRIVNAVAS
jgi:hypothetical protein